MKTRINGFFVSGTALVVCLLVGGCSPESSKAQTKTSTPAVSFTNLMPAEAGNLPPIAPVAVETPPPRTTPAALPSNISPSSPLAQVIRLTQAGVDESIILTFVTNSTRTFNLDSEKIIYLSDLGAPTDLITAIMQRDQDLQTQFAAEQAEQQAQQVQSAQPAPVTESAPTDAAEVAAQSGDQPAPVTVNYFYDTLQPYGSWLNVGGYGYCWRPTASVYNPGWQPYCDRGNWVYTDRGWYWNSDYAWGATFHYGRWFRNPSYGWCWYPGTVWAPSWVTWRYSNNYCGWAPLPPRTSCQTGIGIVYNGRSVGVGFNFGLGANCYTFVPKQNFCDPHPRNYCVTPAQLVQVYNQTAVINNFNIHNHAVVNQGIAVNNIAAAVHNPIHPMPVRDVHPGVAHFQPHQPDNHFSQRNDRSHNNFAGNNDSALRTDPASFRHSPPPDNNLIARSDEPSRFNSLPVGISSQPKRVYAPGSDRTTTGNRNNLPSPIGQIQAPAAGFHPQLGSQTGQQIGAPHVEAPRPNNWLNTTPKLQNRNFQPTANTYAPPGHNWMSAMNQPAQAPTPRQMPPTVFRQPAAPSTWQRAGVPRSYNNRPGAPATSVGIPQHQHVVAMRQNYRAGPVRPATPPQSSQGGGQWGNHGSPGH